MESGESADGVWLQRGSSALVKTLQGWFSTRASANESSTDFPFRLSFGRSENLAPSPQAGWDAALSELRRGHSLVPPGAIYAQIAHARNAPVQTTAATKDAKSEALNSQGSSDGDKSDRIPAYSVADEPQQIVCFPVSHFSSTTASRRSLSVDLEDAATTHLTWATPAIRPNSMAVSGGDSIETYLDWSEEGPHSTRVSSRSAALEPASLRIDVPTDSPNELSSYLLTPSSTRELSTEQSTSSSSTQRGTFPNPWTPCEIEAGSLLPDSDDRASRTTGTTARKARVWDFAGDLEARWDRLKRYLLTHWRWVSSCVGWTILLFVVVIVLSLGTHDHITGSDYILPKSGGSDTETVNATSAEAVTRLQREQIYHDVDTRHRGDSSDPAFSTVEYRHAMPPFAQVDSHFISEATRQESVVSLSPAEIISDAESSEELKSVELFRIDPSDDEGSADRCVIEDPWEHVQLDQWELSEDIQIVIEIKGRFLDGGNLERNACYEIAVSLTPEEPRMRNLTLSEMLNANSTVLRVELFSEDSTNRRLRSSHLEDIREVAYDGVAERLSLSIQTRTSTTMQLIGVLDSPLSTSLHIYDRDFDIRFAPSTGQGIDSVALDQRLKSDPASPEPPIADLSWNPSVEVLQPAAPPVVQIDSWDTQETDPLSQETLNDEPLAPLQSMEPADENEDLEADDDGWMPNTTVSPSDLAPIPDDAEVGSSEAFGTDFDQDIDSERSAVEPHSAMPLSPEPQEALERTDLSDDEEAPPSPATTEPRTESIETDTSQSAPASDVSQATTDLDFGYSTDSNASSGSPQFSIALGSVASVEIVRETSVLIAPTASMAPTALNEPPRYDEVDSLEEILDVAASSLVVERASSIAESLDDPAPQSDSVEEISPAASAEAAFDQRSPKTKQSTLTTVTASKTDQLDADTPTEAPTATDPDSTFIAPPSIRQPTTHTIADVGSVSTARQTHRISARDDARREGDDIATHASRSNFSPYLLWGIYLSGFTLVAALVALALRRRRKKSQNIAPQLAPPAPPPIDSASDSESVLPDMDLPTGRSDIDQLLEEDEAQRRATAEERRDLDSASGRRPRSSKRVQFRGVYFPFKSIPIEPFNSLSTCGGIAFESLRTMTRTWLRRPRTCKIVSEI